MRETATLRPGYLPFIASIVFSLTLPALAADNLTDKQKDDIGKACIAAGDVCRDSCGAKYPNRNTSFNEGLLFDRCEVSCNNIENKCLLSVRIGGSASPGGGRTLDPGSGGPPARTKTFQKPNTRVFSK